MSPALPVVETTIDGIRADVAVAIASGKRVALVPTMGALHVGHLSLMVAARARAEHVITSVFVNPTQFAAGEDLESYPRDLDADLALMAELGDAKPDTVFAPSVDEMYPSRSLTSVRLPELASRLCGASRPTHFDGVGLVVTKLFNIVGPDLAVFGRKDYQQLAIIRRMVADLNQPVEIVGAPIVREPGGLAMSSRNRYLEPAERQAALALSRGLRAVVERARSDREIGRETDLAGIHEILAGILGSQELVSPDYVEILDPDTLAPLDRTPRGDGGEAHQPVEPQHVETDARADTRLLVAVAAFVGRARLIDNVVIGEPEEELRLLAATTPI